VARSPTLGGSLPTPPHVRDPSWRRGVRRRLAAWFKRRARDLPWRRTRDPYAVWVSEIMLQQTQVAAVVPYFERFLARFPGVAQLAAAPVQDVLRLWEGLGYYRRARQMHEAARQMVQRHGGEFPRTLDEARALPGIGRYTAGAVLSIARDARLPILEANSRRVLARLAAFRGDGDSSSGQKLLWRVAELLLPARGSGTFNQALMELGSQVCTPRDPRCEACPLAGECAARNLGLAARIPSARKKREFVSVREAAVVVRRNGRVLVRQCAAGERWEGLWDFPRFAVSVRRGEAPAEELVEKVRALTGVVARPGRAALTIKHGVTRFRITLVCHEAEFVRRDRKPPEGLTRWVTPGELADLPMNSTGRRIARTLTAEVH
jgi:A/G-specific adenine glycosylase